MTIVGLASVSSQTKEGVELGKVIEVKIAKVVDHPQLGSCGFATIGKKVEVYVKGAKKGDKIQIIVTDVAVNAATKKMEAVFERQYVVDRGVQLGKPFEVTIASEFLNNFTKAKSGLTIIGENVEFYIPNAKTGEKYTVIVKAIEISAFTGKPEVSEFDIVK